MSRNLGFISLISQLLLLVWLSTLRLREQPQWVEFDQAFSGLAKIWLNFSFLFLWIFTFLHRWHEWYQSCRKSPLGTIVVVFIEKADGWPVFAPLLLCLEKWWQQQANFKN